MKVVIRCGGSGTRLWPLSRERRPKQFQPLLGQRSLFVMKLADVRPLLRSWNDLYVSTVRQYVPFVRQLAPRVKADHIIAEPIRRNTGPAIALETAVIAAHQRAGSDPVIASLTVDDVFKDSGRLRQVVRRAARFVETVEPSAVVTIGAPVSRPDSGVSYLVLGRVLERTPTVTVGVVTRWIEKPSGPRLSRLVHQPKVAVHTGQYVWRASTVLHTIQAHDRALAGRLSKIQAAIGTRRYATVLARAFRQTRAASVEELVTRRAQRVVGIVAEMGWSDTGKWFLIQELRRQSPRANVIDGTAITLETEDSLVRLPTGKVGVMIGLKGMVVVDTGDALLVCSKDRSEVVKRAVERIRQLGWNRVR